MMFIATVKIPKNPDHNPQDKQAGTCPVSKGYCSDTTGEHHSYVVTAGNIQDAHRVVKEEHGFRHITRIESI